MSEAINIATGTCSTTGTTVAENASNVLLIHEAISMIRVVVNSPETLEPKRLSDLDTRQGSLPGFENFLLHS